jgi:hypothetical protein
MALQYTTESGQTLIVPGAYAETQVKSTPSTVAANGIILAVGEADSGPSYSEETDITQNAFGPDQKAEVLAKYGSGPLVDAFVGAVAASNDNNIKNSFSRFVPVKTNTSVKAASTISAIGGGTFANIVAKSAGKPGNLITRKITAEQNESVPTTGPVILVSPQVTTTMDARVNGGAAVTTASLASGDTPTALKTKIDDLAGVTASGGVARTVIDTTRNVTVGNVSGYACTFTSTTNWAANPSVGDVLYIPSGSQFASANEGSYVVQAVTNTIITALKIIDATGTGVTRTAPTGETVAATAAADFECYNPVTISVTAGAVVPGLGKSLELANTSSGVFANLVWAYNTTTQTVSKASVVSVSGSPVLLTSANEYKVNFNSVRQRDSISEEIVVGGSPVFSIGYTGTTASAVIASGVMTVTLTGGSSVGLSPITVTLADFPTIADLSQYFNSLPGFTAGATLATYNSVSPLRLDAGTYTFATTWGVKTGRIKTDGANFMEAVNGTSILVNVVPTGTNTTLVGLPDVVSLGFLSGGARGATTNADISAALETLQAVKGNFVVPLFSNDATVDVAAGTTDAGSTYDIASINSAVRAHCLQMSQLKRRRRRLGMLSMRSTFTNSKNSASNIASERCVMVFQDIRDNNSIGSLTTFKPWMTAIKAAAMQAGGFYKDITHKYIACSGVTVPGGGFNYNLNSNLEDALKAGLLPVIFDGSGYKWVSDQTTYSVDDNFVFNSLQAMYAADLVAATAEERMERAFVGQSLADVSAETAKTVFGAIMDDMRGLKLIAPSDDAKRGFKNLTIRIVNGNAMVVSVEIKLATSIKFVPILFMISAIQQTATG